ncbi:MAG: peroxiredoxin [Actinomycetota bacterium]|nr:peroxiredoxin [Actinomycetota bacterium]
MTMKLLIGDYFTEVTANTTKGEITLPDAYLGSWFVLFSHPADFTPVCTTEFVAFQKRSKEFDSLGTKLIGLSVDSIEDHHGWVAWIKENLHIGIEFPIIDDADRKVSLALGMLRDDSLDTVTARSVVIVDDMGIVRTILEYPKEIGRNLDEVVRVVKALQLADARGVNTPANWPHNELVGDKVIIPPGVPVSDEEIEAEGITVLSDWFRYKELI